jgi:ABC-type polysaccharide/polyol phosphate export permease
MKLLAPLLQLEWNHLRRDRSSIVWMVIMPFLFMLFFGTIFGGGDSKERENQKLSLRVVDDDRSETSRMLAALLDTTRFEMTTDSTKAVRTIIIPAEFQDSVLAAHRVNVRRVTHRGDLENELAADAGILRSLIRFHGMMAAANPNPAGWSDSSRAKRDAVLQASSPVRVDAAWAGRGIGPMGFRQSVPGNLTVFVLMSTVIGASTLLVVEKSSGVLRRIAAGPISTPAFLASRIVPRFIIAIVQVVILLGGARLFFGYSPGPSPLAFFAVAAAFALTCVGIGTLLGSFFSTVQQAAMSSWISSMLMASIGGAWWPLEVVPSWMRTIAHIFPTAWAMDGFHAVATYGGGFREAALPIVVLLAMAAATITVGTRIFRAVE